MKNKILTWLGIIAAMGVLAVAVTFGMLELADNPADKQASADIDTSEYKTVPKEEEPYSSTIATVEGSNAQLHITKESQQYEVIKAMHSMTHQKVVAEQKWGAIPMTKLHAEAVVDILNNTNFEKKAELLAIAERWANGDFSKIVEDHNYFWSEQEGNIGKATGTMNSTDEEFFVLNNFGDEVAKKMSQDGDL
ncbi:PRK06770 family protein [Bacillus anthracis]|uniref:PRK06770 family protein n=1 Tax=Bacillus anthracis TaxID=1392 RepID=UPI002DBC57C8|nr:PRK06770 family protein [Bacillus anthracis]MEC0017437.1 PRK06770 family protein [Bacillus anthracis]